jgi:hypothetical protein
MIATHRESRNPAVTYFQPRGTSAIVQEIPERTVASHPLVNRGQNVRSG